MNNNDRLNRREFMYLLATAAAAYPLPSLAEKRNQPARTPANLAEPWTTIAAVQQHLFPAETDSPGASDIQALEYLRTMINAPDIDQEEREFIKNGVGWLNELADKQYSNTFIQLDSDSREKILRRIETSRAGERWLSLILSYLIEALLTDPVYRGNPDGIGWRWLHHQPGYPTPPEDKQYFKLGKIRYRSTRA